MAEKNVEAGFPAPRVSYSEFKNDSTSENQGGLQTVIGDLATIEVTDEQNRRVLRKIDRT